MHKTKTTAKILQVKEGIRKYLSNNNIDYMNHFLNVRRFSGSEEKFTDY